MEKLNIPEVNFKTKINSNGKTEVFDIIRRKYIVMTPEEYVRQSFIHFLINYKDFPASLMSVEKGLKVNNQIKRTDIVQYDKSGKARIIIECKAPHIKIDESTFSQTAMYNMQMKVDYLIMTNGITHYCAKVNYDNSSIEYLKDIPNFNTL